MTLLILSVVAWSVFHWLKRLAPDLREKIGRGFVNIGILASLIGMVIGYRQAPYIEVYTPLPKIGYLNNVLMVAAFYLMGVGGARAEMSRILRHPMLWGGAVWGAAHLLVNGDLASIILFGGILTWGLVSQPIINHAEGPWQRPETRGWGLDASVFFTALVLIALIGMIHAWFGHNPFLGTYG